MQAKTQKGGEKLFPANGDGGGSNGDHEKTYTWKKCKLRGKRYPGGSKSCWTLTKNKKERLRPGNQGRIRNDGVRGHNEEKKSGGRVEYQI